MKNRRFAIVAFLLVATLVMGIGFATVTGQLNINGNAKYNSKAETDSSVHGAVKFTAAAGDANCTAKITDTVNGDIANMIVIFNDQNGTGELFTATATYTVKYETTDMSLPDITFSVPNITNTNSDKFEVSTSWDSTAPTLKPGEEATLTVTVSYQATASETGVQNATITIPLPYASVAGGSAT